MGGLIRKSILAGLTISIGGTAFLAVGGGTLGAFLFGAGLMLVWTRGLNLFTGKVCFVRGDGLRNLLIILVFNLIAAMGVGLLMSYIKPEFAQFAKQISERKLAEGLLVIPLGMLCNIMIYFAVDNLIIRGGEIARSLNTILCVMVFILCGFEHSIANTFYLAVSGDLFTPGGLLYIGLNVIGNALGGTCIYALSEGRFSWQS